MTGVLLSKGFVAAFGGRLAAASAGADLQPVHLPDDPQLRLDAAECAKIAAAYLTRDMRHSAHYRSFCDAVLAAPALRWVHFVSAGIDQHPFLPTLAARGVRFTTSAGANGEPAGQTAICGMLMLARGYPHWMAAQHRHEWAPLRDPALPHDLRGQTIMVVGLGTIGTTVARFGRTLGMHVIGVRRGLRRADDPVDELVALAALPDVLPRCHWVVLACPCTDETRHMMNARTMALLPRGARVINVARGGLIDEPALIAALENGHLGGALLDVFEREPLPADSPLWDMPNVFVMPHSAAVSSGNDARAADIFLANLARWLRGEPLANERPG